MSHPPTATVASAAGRSLRLPRGPLRLPPAVPLLLAKPSIPRRRRQVWPSCFFHLLQNPPSSVHGPRLHLPRETPFQNPLACCSFNRLFAPLQGWRKTMRPPRSVPLHNGQNDALMALLSVRNVRALPWFPSSPSPLCQALCSMEEGAAVAGFVAVFHPFADHFTAFL